VRLLSIYGQMTQAKAVPHADVVEFARVRRLLGRGIGWIDAHLLASTIAAGLQLWTADARLAAVAAELDVAYRAG
jgi:predicted nucleic acid-binding protein